jgi:hypothetical protein
MGACDRWSTPVRPKPRRRVPKRNFYDDDCLTEAERVQLKKAAKVENLGDEVALLRVRLKKALKDKEDYEVVVRGMDRLVKAVSAQYRLTPASKENLAESLAAVLNSFGDHILRPDR